MSRLGGFYDRTKFNFVKVEDVAVVAASGTPAGPGQRLSARLCRHFHQINIPAMSEDDLRSVFGTVLSGFLSQFGKDIATHGALVPLSMLPPASLDRVRLGCALFMPLPSHHLLPCVSCGAQLRR